MTEFVKYHGLGNDFVVVDRADEEIEENLVRWMCHRRRGIGADGVLVVSPADGTAAAGKMTLYNRDGSRPEMCGNGIRCVVRHLVEQGRTDAAGPVVVETDAGLRECRIVAREESVWRVAVEMGEASVAESPVTREVNDRRRRFLAVDVGNPHAVSFEPASLEVVDAFGAAMNERRQEPFDEGVNIEFVERIGPNRYEAIVYERGVGRTLACGTGACAVAAAVWASGRSEADRALEVRLPGGSLEIRRDDEGSIWMTGPAARVFRGAFDESKSPND